METSPRASRLRAEIAEQPQVAARLLEREGEAVRRLGAQLARRAPPFVALVARGSSDNAARYAQVVLGLRLRWPAYLAVPSLVTLYGRPPRLRQALVVAISQSGRSPDVVETLTNARRQGALTLAIVNDALSPLAKEAGVVLPLHAGPERSIAATKSYTAELTAVALLAASIEGCRRTLDRVRRIPELLALALETEAQAARVAGAFANSTHAVVLARGVHHATSHELALKLKEMALVAAEASSSADFRHGPIALAHGGRLPAIVIQPPGSAAARELGGLTRALQRLGSPVWRIGAPGPRSIPLPPCDEWLSPLPAIVAGQWLAYHAARARALDPGRPRGIRKVTKTR